MQPTQDVGRTFFFLMKMKWKMKVKERENSYETGAL